MSKIIIEGIASLLWSYLSLPLQSEEEGRLTVNKSLSEPFEDPQESLLFRNDHDRDLRVTAVATEPGTPLRKQHFFSALDGCQQAARRKKPVSKC